MMPLVLLLCSNGMVGIDSEQQRMTMILQFSVWYPQRGELKHVQHPIRDLAAAGDGLRAFGFTNCLSCGAVASVEASNIDWVRERLAGAIKGARCLSTDIE